MDYQSAQPPPFHFMFDANAHGLGAGAQMEVSKYPGGSIQQEQYSSGYRQFKPVPGRGYVYGPSGNWGQRHYYHYTPIKQHDGASGVLSQIAQPNAYKYKVANLGRLGRVDPQLPRGGSIIRVVGRAGGDDEGDLRAFDSSYDWRNSGQPGPLEVRQRTDVGRADLPLGANQATVFPDTSTQVTQTDLAAGVESGAQTDLAAGVESGAQTYMTAADIEELMTLLDESVAQANELEREVRNLRAQIATEPSTSSTGVVTNEAIQAQVDELAAKFSELYAEYQAKLIELPRSSEGMDRETRRAWAKAMQKIRGAGGFESQLQMLRDKLMELHRAAGYTAREAEEFVQNFEQGLGGSTGISTGESSQQQQQQQEPEPMAQDLPPFVRREPRSTDEAERQADWIGNTVINVLSTFLTPQEARVVANRVWLTVMGLFTRYSTAAIAVMIERVMGLLANRPGDPGQARELAQQIMDFIARNYR